MNNKSNGKSRFTDLNRTPKQGALWLVEAVFIKTDGQLDQTVAGYFD